jgi:hypothetical protein
MGGSPELYWGWPPTLILLILASHEPLVPGGYFNFLKMEILKELYFQIYSIIQKWSLETLSLVFFWGGRG